MLWDLLAILVLQVLYVSVMTVRWIILVRGGRWLASAVSFVEVIIYVIGLGLVFSDLKDPLKVLVYALGYAVGALAGSYVEEKLALGNTVFQIITREPDRLVPALRDVGLGVTAWPAQGRDGPRGLLMVVARRRWVPELMKVIAEVDPRCFVVRLEPQALHGGFLSGFLFRGRYG